MRRNSSRWMTMLLGLSLAMAGEAAWTQFGQAPPEPTRRPSRQQQPPRVADDTLSSTDRALSRKMLKASYEQLQKDVLRLSDLAAELKEEVTKTGDEDVLSLSGVKKAEEIEKLSKKIQSRMKNL